MEIPDKAFWIGSDHAFDLHETYLNFRRDIDFASVPQSAKLTITADSRYRLWINGTYVCRGPARCWPDAQQVDAIDIAPYLKSSTNRIAVQVYSPGYSHFAYVHSGACELLAWLEIDGETALVTDQNWRVQRDLSWNPLVPRVSIYGSGVESRDLNLDHNWQHEDPTGESWKTPRIVSPANGPIWSGLKPRNVPMLAEEKLALTDLFQFRRGHFVPDRKDPHQALREAFVQCPVDTPPDSPVEILAGETAIWIFDLGSSQTGIAGVDLEGLQGGETLLVSYAEKLRDGELLTSDPSTYCRMRPTDVFTLRPGAQSAEGFSQRGGRYMIFALHAPETGTVTANFYFKRTVYPLLEKPLKFTDPALAKIAAMCRTSVINCLQDGFVDSVWRESSQWLGDCVAEAFALAAISDDPRPLRRAIVMAAEGAYPDGILPSVLPGEVHAYTITDYNFSWIELLDMYWRHPVADDRQTVVEAMLPVMHKMLERMHHDVGSDSLLISQSGRRLFLDWSGVDRREPSLTYNARYLHALHLAARLADLFDVHATLAQIYRRQARALAESMVSAFRVESGWCENLYGTPASQLGLSLAILTGLLADDEASAAADAVIARSMDMDESGNDAAKLVLASPFMHHYVFQALAHLGRDDAIADIIRTRWGHWAEAGESTTWENWNIDFPDGSKCHGFSAHPLGWMR